MTAPLVTVVIPTRNRRELLGQALASVLDQTVDDLEVVVVDEGSSDDTPCYLARQRDPRVRVVRHDEPRGLGAARNAGIAQASGRWTAFLDDDDLWAPGKLEAQLEALGAIPSAGWGSVGAVRVDPALGIIGFHRLADTGDLLRRTLESNLIPGSGSGVIARTTLLREVGGFREDLVSSQDWELWIRLAAASPIAMADAPLMAYRIATSSMSHVPDLERRATEQIRALHEDLAAELGYVPHGEVTETYLARLDLAAGRRAAAVRRLLALGRRRSRYVLLAGAAAVAPRTWERHVARVAERRMWPGWRATAEAWLAAHRQPSGTARRDDGRDRERRTLTLGSTPDMTMMIAVAQAISLA